MFIFQFNACSVRVTVENNRNRTKTLVDVHIQSLNQDNITNGIQIPFTQQPAHVNRYRLYVSIIDSEGTTLSCV